MAGEVGRGRAGPGQFRPRLDHVGIGDLLRARTDLDGGAVIAHQGPQLFEQIGPEIIGLGDRRRVETGALELGGRALDARHRSHRGVVDAKLRIAEPQPRLEIGNRTVVEEALQCFLEGFDRPRMESPELAHRGLGRVHGLDRSQLVVMQMGLPFWTAPAEPRP